MELIEELRRILYDESHNCTGSVYFIHAPHSLAIKIGYSKHDPDRRMADIQTGTPEPLDLIGDIAGSFQLERAIHRQFKRYRLRGEWYKLCPDIRQFCFEYVFPFEIEGPDFSSRLWNCHHVTGVAAKECVQ